MSVLGIDVGSTNIKAGLFTADGERMWLGRARTPVRTDRDGGLSIDPEELWRECCGLVRSAVAETTAVGTSAADAVVAIGVTSMSETGLLADAESGAPRSPFVPWFDGRSAGQASLLAAGGDELDLLATTGLRPSGKYGLAKILWLRAELGVAEIGATWLSVADYVAFRLCGRMWTSPSLAARTYAYQIEHGRWDAPRLRRMSIPESIFPPVRPSIGVAEQVLPGVCAALGLPGGIVVANAGHDHVCAAFAAESPGSGPPDAVLVDSFGTAEVVLGTMPMRTVDRADFDAALSFGPAIEPGRMFALGGISSAGAAVDWYTESVLSVPGAGIGAVGVAAALDRRGIEPPARDAVVFVPRSATSSDAAPGVFTGPVAAATGADVAFGLLSGLCYEAEAIRRRVVAGAHARTGVESRRATSNGRDRDSGRVLCAGGGGPLLETLLRIKADVYGQPLEVPIEPELAVRGAALIAAVSGDGRDGTPSGDRLRATWRDRLETRFVAHSADRHRRHAAIFSRIFERNAVGSSIPAAEE